MEIAPESPESIEPPVWIYESTRAFDLQLAMKIKVLFAVNGLLAAIVVGLLQYTGKPMEQPPAGEKIWGGGSDAGRADSRPDYGAELTTPDIETGSMVAEGSASLHSRARPLLVQASAVRSGASLAVGTALQSASSPTSIEHVAADSQGREPEAASPAGTPSSVSSVSGSTAFSGAPMRTSIDSAASGNHLVVKDQLVTVEGITSAVDGGVDELAIAINPAARKSPAAVAPKIRAPRPRTGEMIGGFTHEEELFRSKWGWAAFDQARRAVLEQP